MSDHPKKIPTSLFQRLAPGILVAATGVGAGDLVNASLAGSELGVAILWAAWLGAVLKWTLNEGIARWQLATGTTLLEGWKAKIGTWVFWIFQVYLILWSVFVGATLIKACGVAGLALTGIGDVFLWGVVHTVAGVILVRLGGFSLFEKFMSVCIAVMFFTVTLSVFKVGVEFGADFWKGLLIPTIPSGGLQWTLGVMGGVGGTVTLLSYGYWIKDHPRVGEEGLKACRLDLAVGYVMTALFGVAMLMMGSRLELDGKGSGVAISISNLLGETVSPLVGSLFLWGFWAAVFSSLLGVWQGVPYLFADFRRILRLEPSGVELESTVDYRRFLYFLGFAPLLVQGLSLRSIAIVYAVLGSLFMPFLAATLLYLNGHCLRSHPLRNPWWVNLGLVATLLFFAYQGLTGAES